MVEGFVEAFVVFEFTDFDRRACDYVRAVILEQRAQLFSLRRRARNNNRPSLECKIHINKSTAAPTINPKGTRRRGRVTSMRGNHQVLPPCPKVPTMNPAYASRRPVSRPGHRASATRLRNAHAPRSVTGTRHPTRAETHAPPNTPPASHDGSASSSPEPRFHHRRASRSQSPLAPPPATSD